MAMSTRKIVHSAKCPLGKLSTRRIVHSAKCPLGEMSTRRIVHSANCPLGEMSTRRNVHSAKCPLGEMSTRRNVHSAKCIDKRQYNEFYGSREVPREEIGGRNLPYPKTDDSYERSQNRYASNNHYTYPEDYSMYDQSHDDAFNYGNYDPNQDFDQGYSMAENADHRDSVENIVNLNNEIGKMPTFLRLTTKQNQQSFMALEQENSRSRSIIERQKRGWAVRNGQNIEKAYDKFARDVRSGKERFMQSRKQILIGLSRQAQDLDRKIQLIISDQNISRRQCLIKVNALLAGSTDQTRTEMREKLHVIGPLDGNFPPIQKANKNDQTLGNLQFG
uniref:Uncharacterized protein n=1 Tax=Globodera rostochiensis TaxID=31243 RepID=A0A914HKX5_GLORO